MSDKAGDIGALKSVIEKEKKVVQEINTLINDLRKVEGNHDKKMVVEQINSLLLSLKVENGKIPEFLKSVTLISPLKNQESVKTPEIKEIKKESSKKDGVSISKVAPKLKLEEIEKNTLKRLSVKKEKEVKVKKNEPNKFAEFSSKFFAKTSLKLSKEEFFKPLRLDLIKSNLEFTPQTYISIALMTVSISAIVGFFLMIFLLFFNVSALVPFITLAEEDILIRFFKVIWIFILLPPLTSLFMYFYPSLEKGTAESRINQELPFATIHMSAISGASIDPIKIFDILNSTKEYPNLGREFKKIINEINVYGLSLIGALRKVSYSTPSKKLSELLNGIAITLSSGGDLSSFFGKRAETLLFDYKIEREKYAKSAETFMDIYISVVIAAPMILMLMLVLMQVAGLGIQLSSNMISLIMILGVSVINVLFLGFLKVKQPTD